MVDPQKYLEALETLGVNFFTGVPDSLLKHFCSALSSDAEKHVITANEGGAIALAAGHYLSTSNIPLVYMQNSGFGNAINPLVSLADKKVYSIPMVLMIGWRGEDGVKDEPQHGRQGELTIKLLDLLGIDYAVMPKSDEEALEVLRKLVDKSRSESVPVALVVRKDSFCPGEELDFENQAEDNNLMSREEAISVLVDESSENDLIVSTTGMASRELYELRKKKGDKGNRDFLTVGSMGHCSQIALGISKNYEEGNIICLDGDGSMLMHMGSMAISGQYAGSNFIHVILNNGSHDSVGGQPTLGKVINIPKIAESVGYASVISTKSRQEVIDQFKIAISADGVSLIEIMIKKGNRKDLGRPLESPRENKEGFMNFINEQSIIE